MLGADVLKFIKSLKLSWYGHTERANDGRMAEQIVTVRTEGMRKRGKPWKRRSDDVEEDLRIMGIRNWRTVARDRKRWMPRSTTDCSA